MQLLKTIFNFYINASIHVAFAVWAFVRITEKYLGLPYNKELNYCIFFAVITGYNFIKYASVAKLHYRSLTKNLKRIQLFSFVCFIWMLFYASKLPLKILVWFFVFGALTFLYAMPVFKKNLRSIAMLKILIIALVWSGVTVLIPVFKVANKITLTAVLIFIQRLFLVVVLTLPFDIRDVNFDSKNLQTLPQKIGVKQTKKVGFILLIVCLLIEFFIAPNAMYKNLFFLLFIVVLFFLMRSKTNQSAYYSSFWVESIPVFWAIILFIFTKN